MDNLALESLELLEEKILLSIQIENKLREGHIELAKARYIRGKESVGMLQIPSEENEVKPLFELETKFNESNGKENSEKEEFPTFDISFKKSDNQEEEIQNPLKWFGVLVPQSLKSAQKHFQDAIFLSVKLANVQSELNKVTGKTDSLKKLKNV